MISTEHIHVNSQTSEFRPVNTQELGNIIRLARVGKKWSQEQLAAISGLSARTIQRVEQGESAGLDTRRALARAFGLDDIDAFNKPVTIPAAEGLQEAQARFDREHVTLAVSKVCSGIELLSLVERSMGDVSEPGFEMARPARETFARLIDYYRDYRDGADLYSQLDKVDIQDQAQGQIDELQALGVSLCYATRRVKFKLGQGPEQDSLPAEILYVVAYPVGKEPTTLSTPKQISR
jgi:transcriptional regulator with XRE-family HTH domain